MFIHTKYSLSVALPIIFFNNWEFKIISKFALYWLFISSVNCKSDWTSPNKALIAPLVLILILGSALSSYKLNFTQNFILHRAIPLIQEFLFLVLLGLYRIAFSCYSSYEQPFPWEIVVKNWEWMLLFDHITPNWFYWDSFHISILFSFIINSF